MLKKRTQNSEGVFKSIFFGYFVLILHVILIAVLGLLVIFFGGIVSYAMWVFLGGSAIIVLSGYLVYKRLEQSGRSLRNILSLPVFNGRPVEISLMGGMASMRIGKPEGDMLNVPFDPQEQVKQLNDPEDLCMKELSELARLFEKELITLDEFNLAKQKFFGISH